jgi:RND family efflux transporter MFP subunit
MALLYRPRIVLPVAAVALSGLGLAAWLLPGPLTRYFDHSVASTGLVQPLDRAHPADDVRPAADVRPESPRAAVSIDGRRQQLIGVRTITVRRGAIRPEVRAAGTVRIDETRQTDVNVKVDGWIRDLYADYTGRFVQRGEPLFTLYSPDLLATQNEYLLAVRSRDRAAGSQVAAAGEYAGRLVDAARQRLTLWDLTAVEIDELEKRGEARETVVVRSPAAGFVVEKSVVKGIRVMAGQTLYRIADLSSVWVEADVYESQLAFARRGARARVTIDALPRDEFQGRVSYVYPYLTEETRTVRVRLALANPGGRLKPGMFANVTLEAPATEALAIPVDALVETGDRRFVFLSGGEGYFEPRDVEIGHRVDGMIEVLSGLEEGDVVAAAATFFLDSESQLRGALEAYRAAGSSGDVRALSPAPKADPVIGFRTDPDPPRMGPTPIEVTVRTPEGRAVADAAVSVVFFMPAMPSMNMPAMKTEAALTHAGDGLYRGTGDIQMAGRWDVTILVSRDGGALGRRDLTIVAR